jgi:hypothetical protein
MNYVEDLEFTADTPMNIVLRDVMFCSLVQITNLNCIIGYLMTKCLLFYATVIVVLVTENPKIYPSNANSIVLKNQSFLKLTYNKAVQELRDGIMSKNATKITQDSDLKLVKTGCAELYNSYTA